MQGNLDGVDGMHMACSQHQQQVDSDKNLCLGPFGDVLQNLGDGLLLGGPPAMAHMQQLVRKCCNGMCTRAYTHAAAGCHCGLHRFVA